MPQSMLPFIPRVEVYVVITLVAIRTVLSRSLSFNGIEYRFLAIFLSETNGYFLAIGSQRDRSQAFWSPFVDAWAFERIRKFPKPYLRTPLCSILLELIRKTFHPFYRAH